MKIPPESARTKASAIWSTLLNSTTYQYKERWDQSMSKPVAIWWKVHAWSTSTTWWLIANCQEFPKMPWPPNWHQPRRNVLRWQWCHLWQSGHKVHPDHKDMEEKWVVFATWLAALGTFDTEYPSWLEFKWSIKSAIKEVDLLLKVGSRDNTLDIINDFLKTLQERSKKRKTWISLKIYIRFLESQTFPLFLVLYTTCTIYRHSFWWTYCT